MIITGHGEKLVVRGKDVILVEGDVNKEYKDAFTGYVKGTSLTIERLSCTVHGILRGTSNIICSHNKLYITGSADTIKSLMVFNKQRCSVQGYGYNDDCLILKGNFSSVQIIDTVFDLSGVFGVCESESNIYFYGNCKEAIAYNSVYNCEPYKKSISL